MRTRNNWSGLLLCSALFALLMTLSFGTVSARAQDEDPNDPALKKTGKKMTPEQLIRIRIAELEGGAIAAIH